MVSMRFDPLFKTTSLQVISKPFLRESWHVGERAAVVVAAPDVVVVSALAIDVALPDASNIVVLLMDVLPRSEMGVLDFAEEVAVLPALADDVVALTPVNEVALFCADKVAPTFSDVVALLALTNVVVAAKMVALL
jgi:hypothetical protein